MNISDFKSVNAVNGVANRFPFSPDHFRCQRLVGRLHFVESHLLSEQRKVLPHTLVLLDPNTMFALRRHSSLSSTPALSSTRRLQRVTRLPSGQMSSKPITRLRQLHQQMQTPDSRTFSTDTASSSTTGNMDSGKSPSSPTQQPETPKPIVEEQPRPVDSGPPVLFKSIFAARTFVLNRPSALNALNHEMIKMIKAKVDVSFVLICSSSFICCAGL